MEEGGVNGGDCDAFFGDFEAIAKEAAVIFYGFQFLFETTFAVILDIGKKVAYFIAIHFDLPARVVTLVLLDHDRSIYDALEGFWVIVKVLAKRGYYLEGVRLREDCRQNQRLRPRQARVREHLSWLFES